MAIQIRRRELVFTLGGAAAWPIAARAQQPGKLPTVGIPGPFRCALEFPWTAGFVERLRQLGWIEGRTIAIDYRWSEGRSERVAEIAAEFVQLKVDVIVTSGSAVPTVKQVTLVIPIVFAMSIDPVGGGLVASLARPGGNVTGLSIQENEFAGKRLEFLHEVVPRLRRLAVIFDGSYPEAVLERHDIETAARTLDIELTPLEIRRAEEIAAAFEALKAQGDALYVVVDALVSANRTRIITLALSARLPTMFSNCDYVQAGALMSYGPDNAHMLQRAADLVDKILRGTEPGDIPVEQPTVLDLTINLTTAKALGLIIPPTLLALANEGRLYRMLFCCTAWVREAGHFSHIASYSGMSAAGQSLMHKRGHRATMR